MDDPRNSARRLLILLALLFFQYAGRSDVYLHGDPSDLEQLLLEWINRARANPLAEVTRLGIDLNQGLEEDEISPDPKPPLAFNQYLIASARGHSDWMLDTDTFSHIGAGGSQPHERMEAAGYPLAGSWQAGENIGEAGNTGQINQLQTLVQIHDGLVKSPPHRVNLFHRDYDEIGLGIRTGVFTQNGYDFNAVMTTENFARSGGTPGPFLLGVIYRDLNRNHAYDAGEGLNGVSITLTGQTDSSVSSTSGGYAVPYSGRGNLNVTFSGPGIVTPALVTTERTGQNIKLDWLVDSSVPAATSLASPTLLSDGSVQFELTGAPGSSISILYSQDLIVWNLLQELVLDNSPSRIIDYDAVTRQQTFYRLQP